MSLTATPYVKIDNNPIQSDLSDTFTMITLSDFTITYGRKSVLDQPSPAQLTAGFLVRRESPWIQSSLAETGIQVWVRYGNTEFRNFIGRIRDTELTYLREQDGAPLYRLEVTATDTLADLERFESYWKRPAESPRQRLDYLQSQLGGIINGIGGVAYTSAIIPKEGTYTALREITALYNAGGEGVWYDPHTHRIESSGRVGWDGLGLNLMKTGTNRYSVSISSDGKNILRINAERARSDEGIAFNLDQVLPQIWVNGYLRELQNTTYVSYSIGRAVAGGNGLGRITVDTPGYGDMNNGTITNQGGIKQTLDFWETLVLDARAPVHPPIISEHTEFDDETALREILGGKELRRPQYIAGSKYTSAVPGLMVGRVLNGTINYRARPDKPGKWLIERAFGACRLTGIPAPVTFKTLNPSTSTVVTFNQLDETVTGHALGYTVKGI